MAHNAEQIASEAASKIVAAFEELGLTVETPNIRSKRLSVGVAVWATQAGWFELAHIGALFTVSHEYGWRERVTVSCNAPSQDVDINCYELALESLIIPIAEIGSGLRETLRQREVVLERVKSGIEGPFWFEPGYWERPTDWIERQVPNAMIESGWRNAIWKEKDCERDEESESER